MTISANNLGLNTFANSDIDFSLSDFCYEQSNVQNRNGIYFLPNKEVGITNISKCIFKNRNGQYHQVEETNEIYYDYKS